MSRNDFGWDYPPGVTGNEPAIAGGDDDRYWDWDDVVAEYKAIPDDEKSDFLTYVEQLAENGLLSETLMNTDPPEVG